MMMLKKLELHGFKSFAKKTELFFDQPVTAIVGPNGSGKSNIVESIRFVLGEQSSKSLRSSSGKDLIFAGSQFIPKMNRASVSLTFDNKNRVFKLTNIKNQEVNIDFDEVILTRTVFTDGSNTYQINGHDVRMKDILELIASVNIGSSGHHIISQGEADRLLNASTKERKQMIEDALGLKLYQYRIKESEKKLEKTHAHMQEIKTLRREIAPHLKFLERQVKKIEQAHAMREELRDKYRAYLARESLLLEQEELQHSTEKDNLEMQAQSLRVIIEEKTPEKKAYPENDEIEKKSQELTALSHEKNEILRTLGKLEGMIEVAQKPAPSANSPKSIRIHLDEVRTEFDALDARLEALSHSETLAEVRTGIQEVRASLSAFLDAHKDAPKEPESPVDNSAQLQELTKAQEQASVSLQQLEEKERTLHDAITELRNSLHHKQAQEKEDQKEYFQAQSSLQHCESQLRMLTMKYEATQKARLDFSEEITEGEVLIGSDIHQYTHAREEYAQSLGEYTRQSQEQDRKHIERLKIKLEEIGGGSGADIIAEFKETKERDEFLLKEMTDVESSVESLEQLIQELRQQLNTEFESGIKRINEQFSIFFDRMFGGGKASLVIVPLVTRKKSTDDNEMPDDDDDDETRTGIEIKVHLPRKKITSLEMLSGGERSLTSIALLFALSQVNPPPFLVLDETDAALDEANSRRYGDMIESLSEYSQLMVVTHNRETMSRANALYGVTIGKEECSQLLSVKFDDAQEFAK